MSLLPPPHVPPLVRTPSRAVQFVVEIVGPRTVPAVQAADLLRPDWRAALGQPEMWAMRPADTVWSPLHAATHGSYDSLALAWDLVTPAGEMSTQAANHLVATTERFANGVGRRAIPLTAPNDIPREVRRLRQIQDGLDIGISLLVVSPRPVAWTEFARELQGRGLTSDRGEFGWRSPDHPEPLFEAIPFDTGSRTDGATLGYRLPRCPDPVAALEGMFRLADDLWRTGLGIFDEDRNPLTPETRERMRQGVRAAVHALESVNLRPGSWATLKAFP